MRTSRLFVFALWLSLAATAGAAEVGRNIVFHTQTDMPDMMPFTSWGPGTMVPDLIMSRLFPPTLIMQHQQELGLTDQQTETIKSEIRTFQSGVVDVQWNLQSSQADLDKLLDADHIDADAAGAAIDRVLAAENDLKRMHLAMLIKIRNALQPAQVEKLEKSVTMARRTWTMPIPPEPPEPPAAP